MIDEENDTTKEITPSDYYGTQNYDRARAQQVIDSLGDNNTHNVINAAVKHGSYRAGRYKSFKQLCSALQTAFHNGRAGAYSNVYGPVLYKTGPQKSKEIKFNTKEDIESAINDSGLTPEERAYIMETIGIYVQDRLGKLSSRPYFQKYLDGSVKIASDLDSLFTYRFGGKLKKIIL